MRRLELSFGICGYGDSLFPHGFSGWSLTAGLAKTPRGNRGNYLLSTCWKKNFGRDRLAALLLVTALPAYGAPLSKRDVAIHRGLKFIVSVANDPAHFAAYGDDLLWCLYSISATSSDAKLRALALSTGRERALVWRRAHNQVPPTPNAGTIAELVFGSYAADRLGVPDAALKNQLRTAASKFSARDYLLFDPHTEPPPANIPGRSRYDIFCDALVTTYTGDRYGITLGAPWREVIKWLPAMRPYRGASNNPEFQDMLYAVTHAVYTMNDYSVRRVNPACLKPEFEFLKANLTHDPEMLGEFMDTLRSFGLNDSDPSMQKAVDFLLAAQNPDGSWGSPKDPDIYNRYHATWTAVDGLRGYRFKPARACRP